MRARRSLALATAVLGAGAAHAERAVEDSIVFIECSADGTTSRGTGVVVSAQGHVLTAKHVVPDGARCAGSIGVADPNTAARLVVQPTGLPVDAALLRFSDGRRDYAAVPYCEVEDWMIRRPIMVAGFPGDTETGAASYREGVLSTTLPNEDGLLETDGQTVEGMSGGPVFSRNLAGLVGIVAGAKFTATGTISYYGILPVSSYAPALGLEPSERACYNQAREVDFWDEEGNWTAVWRVGDGPVALDVGVDEGFCFLESVFGDFNHPEDEVWVTDHDGVYEMDGRNLGGGAHGATARCIWYD